MRSHFGFVLFTRMFMLLGVLLAGNPAQASCEALFRQPWYDETRLDVNSNLDAAVTSTLCDDKISTWKQATTRAESFGLSLPFLDGIGINAASANNADAFTQFKAKYCASQSSRQQLVNSTQLYVRKVNPEFIKVLALCIDASRRGLRCNVDNTTDRLFTFSAEYIPFVDSVRTIKLLEAPGQTANLQCKWWAWKNIPIGRDELNVICTRKDDNEARITLNGKNGSCKLTLPAIQQPLAVAPEAPPVDPPPPIRGDVDVRLVNDCATCSCKGLYLDIKGDTGEVITYHTGSASGSLWSLSALPPATSSGITVTLKNLGNSKYLHHYLDINGGNGNLMLNASNASGTKWTLKPRGDGRWTFQNEAISNYQNFFLDIDGKTCKVILTSVPSGNPPAGWGTYWKIER